ncbi:MAG TPA: hypothetical protein VMW41_06000 [Candidatus Bathyarchaeia archaeon]|nr:hypothetical protein [Candidatus Bathyarchaeia archaeon]
MKKTWLEKLENRKNFPKILKLEKRFPCYNAMHKREKKYQVAGFDKYLIKL